jgi:hypothetical protein
MSYAIDTADGFCPYRRRDPELVPWKGPTLVPAR